MFCLGRTKFFAQRQQLPWPAPATALVACILFPCTVALRALQVCSGEMMGWLDDGVSSWGTGGWRLTWVCLFVAFSFFGYIIRLGRSLWFGLVPICCSNPVSQDMWKGMGRNIPLRPWHAMTMMTMMTMMYVIFMSMEAVDPWKLNFKMFPFLKESDRQFMFGKRSEV